MTTLLFTIGLVSGAVLLTLLCLTLRYPRISFWPTPGQGTWQAFLFWPLFRSLNVLCFVVAAADRTVVHGLPWRVRGFAFVLLTASILLFLYAFRVLGRDNSYCAREGLVTSGIYRWSRNPQNALLIVVYGCLAFAADGVRVYILCAAMIGVYALMVRAEEPWLRSVYGSAYDHYCQRVPRFFNWSRAGTWLRVTVRQTARQFLTLVRTLQLVR